MGPKTTLGNGKDRPYICLTLYAFTTSSAPITLMSLGFYSSSAKTHLVTMTG